MKNKLCRAMLAVFGVAGFAALAAADSYWFRVVASNDAAVASYVVKAGDVAPAAGLPTLYVCEVTQPEYAAGWAAVPKAKKTAAKTAAETERNTLRIGNLVLVATTNGLTISAPIIMSDKTSGKPTSISVDKGKLVVTNKLTAVAMEGGK